MDGQIKDAIFTSLLERTGGMQDIKQAITTKDLAAIVRAATGALKKTSAIPMVVAERKSAELSIKYRKDGNLYYKNKKYKGAIICYNKALAYGPNNSLEVKLAYGNISAVMLNIKAYRDCQLIIKTALELGCPEILRVKLENRMNEAKKYIMVEINMMQDMMLSDEDVLNYGKFDVKRNAEIPCVSTDVCVDDAKKVVAAKEIKSGTMVALERAFVSVQDEYDKYTSCYYCQRLCFFFIPCEGCCKALFCSKECREKCLEEYHRIECHIVAYMGVGSIYKTAINQLAVRAAIKMSLKLGWEELRVASLEMGEKRLKKSSISEAFDCNNAVSMLCYNDQVTVSSDKMIHASLICAAAVHCLDRVPGYFPEEKRKREKAIDTLSRIMLQLNTTFLRQIKISCSTFDYLNENYRWNSQCNAGWFSFTSKLTHSCEPNLLVLGFNDHVALVALQRIKKGDQLTISFPEHFYDMNLTLSLKNSRLRQKEIYNSIQYKCECRVCLLEWHTHSHTHGTLTNRQETVYNQYNSAMNSSGFAQKITAIGAALDELGDCINTTQHYTLYRDLRRTLNICQCVKDSNKTYNFVSKFNVVL